MPDLADAIVEITETGSSLKANNLKIIDTVLETTTRFIANKEAYKSNFKRKKMENIIMMLQSVIDAIPKVCIMMNAPHDKLKEILAVIPDTNPTVSNLAKGDWVDILAIMEKKELREVLPKLKAHGAKAIAEIPINKIID